MSKIFTPLEISKITSKSNPNIANRLLILSSHRTERASLWDALPARRFALAGGSLTGFTKIGRIFIWVLIISLMCLGTEHSAEEKSVSGRRKKSIPFAIGQWVKYQVKRYKKDQPTSPPRDLSEAELKISIVGKRTIRDKEFIWVEVLINEDREQERVVKFLIDKNGIPQPERLILKYGKMQAVEIDLHRWEVKTRVSRARLFEEMTRGLNIIPFTRLIPPEEIISEEEIPVNIGGKGITLKCIKTRGPRHRAWYSDKIPLAGLVKFFLPPAGGAGGQAQDKYYTMILLSDYGTKGGESVITETPRKLNFQEGG